MYICIHRKHEDTLSIKTACLNEWIKMWDTHTHTHTHTHTQWNTTQPCKGQNNAICSNVDGPRGDHSKWSKPDQERQRPYDITQCVEPKIWRTVVVVQGLSCVWLLDLDSQATPWTAACQAPRPSTVSWGFAQTQVHWVSVAILPSHPLLSPSPVVFNLSQHQGLFQWVGSSNQVAKVLELQHQSFQWILRVDFL